MKYIGIDYGTKRIGVAVSNEDGTMAFPLSTISAGPHALSEVHTLIQNNKAEGVVIGESKNLHNEPNAVQEDIEQFKKDLEELSGLPVAYQAEFFTTAQASRQGQDKRGEGGVEKSDASAAALILQSYLDTLQK
ncbi:MAG: Holliday junction resolvase RuvX [Patescibacteria group bacterium]